ncbi:hypothetical protein [Flavobacterium piscisymbiosum]|uniref:Lipoprotein n=1 Tax=Flavobacterium piscisymbiosum TaxID=2893753 RepID=A0ABS8M9A4_9FLAO|nr:hypothetical protein [Flavobacterium sp. F-30]MCC9062019.1 hypothetical protein [Flavobacterium sp. F-30]
MQRITCFLILIIIFSCNERKANSEIKPDSKNYNDQGIQEIGQLYNPENITTRPIKLYNNDEEKNYEIDIFNSDLLLRDKENLKPHSDKIALLLKNHLIKNNVIYNDIIVRIYQKNDGKQSFQYSDKELIEIKNKRHLNQSQKN